MKLIWQVCIPVIFIFTLSCKKPPEYPKVPEIAFKTITIQKINQRQGPNYYVELDSVTICLDFKDGDGDLGRSDDENNYFCRVLIKEKDVYKDIVRLDTATNQNVPVSKDGKFFPLNVDGREGPIEGQLFYGPSLEFDAFVPDSLQYTLKFQVYIKDNAGNASNVVETIPVLVRLY